MTPSHHQTTGAGSASDLLAQRTQLQEWLRRLDGVDDIPLQVARRVRADYEQRLAAVVAELSAHRDSLSADRERLDETLLAAAERHDAASDALEEARLRHRIGELSEEDWETRRPQLESEVESASSERETTEREIAALEELLGQLTIDTRSTEATPPAAVTTEEVPAGEGEAEGAWFDAPALEADEEAEEWVPELHLLDSPDEGPAERGPSEERAPEGGETGETDRAAEETSAADQEPLDISAYRPDPDAEAPDDLVEITTFAAAAEALADDAEPAQDDDDYAFLQELDRAIAATAPTGEKAEEESDTRPQPGLKCPDCGYSNDPAAWYCGVCGVDLG